MSSSEIFTLSLGLKEPNESLMTYEEEGYKLYNLSVVNRVSNGGLLELNAFMMK